MTLFFFAIFLYYSHPNEMTADYCCLLHTLFLSSGVNGQTLPLSTTTTTSIRTKTKYLKRKNTPVNVPPMSVWTVLLLSFQLIKGVLSDL